MLTRTLVCFCLTAVLLPATADAQLGPAALAFGNGAITGTGTETVSRPVDTMRLSIVLTGRAKELKQALAALRDRQDAAQLQLESMGAEKDAIELSPASLAKKSQQQIQMEEMLKQQRQAQGRAIPKGLQVSTQVAVQSTLTAQWPLDQQDPESMLQFVTDLQEKIKEADLAGVNEPGNLSAAEQELAEELAGMSSMYGQQESKPGEPSFTFIGRIGDEERKQAMKQAFEKAKLQAGQLAAAAGVELGPLASLQGNVTAQQSGMSAYDYAYYMQVTGTQEEAADNEAVGSEPQSVKFKVTVIAAFKLP